jgi:hypothetical protein
MSALRTPIMSWSRVSKPSPLVCNAIQIIWRPSTEYRVWILENGRIGLALIILRQTRTTGCSTFQVILIIWRAVCADNQL